MKLLSDLFQLNSSNGSGASVPPQGSFAIAQDHPVREPVLGFIDSRNARRSLIKQLKNDDHSTPAYIIALDARNLGALNDTLGRENADKVWQIHMEEYVRTLNEQFPQAEVFAGFRSHGDEAQIIISSKRITASKIEKAINKAASLLHEKFEQTGLSQLPARSSEKPPGFGLHHAIHRIYEDKNETQPSAIVQTSPAMMDASQAPELTMVMTTLNQNKQQAETPAYGVSADEFTAKHKADIDALITEHEAEIPAFIWPEQLKTELPALSDQASATRQHREFIESAPPGSVLLRFDLSGLRLLNKYLSALEVESILERINEVIDHHFIVARDTYDRPFQSYDVGSGIVDVMLDEQAWESSQTESLEHINYSLEQLYDLHIKKDYCDTWDKLGPSFYSASSEERDKALMDLLGENARELLDKLDRQFNFVQVPVINNNPQATLDSASAAMEELKKSTSPAGNTNFSAKGANGIYESKPI